MSNTIFDGIVLLFLLLSIFINNFEGASIILQVCSASVDLSHVLQEYGPYGFSKEGPIYEQKIINTMTSANFLELLNYDTKLLDLAKECGHPSFTIMGGIWSKTEVIPKFFSHEDVTGV